MPENDLVRKRSTLVAEQQMDRYVELAVQLTEVAETVGAFEWCWIQTQFYGLRQKERLELLWQKVVFRGGSAGSDSDGRDTMLHIQNSKDGSHRVIYVDFEFDSALRLWRREQSARFGQQPYVFTSVRGKPLNAVSEGQMWKQFLGEHLPPLLTRDDKELGISVDNWQMRLNRHIAAELFIAGGTPPELLEKITG